MRGSALEALVRGSAEKFEDQGLCLHQTSPRFVGRIGQDGQAVGRVTGKGALDFFGDYLGRFVTLDCKANAIKTSFPLKNIENHQAKIVKGAHERGAVAFFLVEFTKLDSGPRYFALTWPTLAPWWNPYRASQYFGGDAPQSIPLKVFEAEALEVRLNRRTLDLLGCIKALETPKAA